MNIASKLETKKDKLSVDLLLNYDYESVKKQLEELAQKQLERKVVLGHEKSDQLRRYFDMLQRIMDTVKRVRELQP